MDTCDAVLGPACDGGFYLLGLRRSAVTLALFRDVAWSTSTVHDTMCDRIRGAGLKLAPGDLLRTLRDIDTVDDLKEWRAQHPAHVLSDVASSCMYCEV
jgi:uncharacterized protein